MWTAKIHISERIYQSGQGFEYCWMCRRRKKVQSKLHGSEHYENTPIQIYRRFHLQKLQKNSDKNPDIFHISAQNIDCLYSLEPPRRGGSNEYPQSMFSSKTKKNNVYPCKPQFYCIKLGFKGVNII